MTETIPLERLFDPESQRQTALDGLRLMAKFFGPDVARREAEGYNLSAEDIEAAINQGTEEAAKQILQE